MRQNLVFYGSARLKTLETSIYYINYVNSSFSVENVDILKDTKGHETIQRGMDKTLAWTYYGQKTSKCVKFETRISHKYFPGARIGKIPSLKHMFCKRNRRKKNMFLDYFFIKMSSRCVPRKTYM